MYALWILISVTFLKRMQKVWVFVILAERSWFSLTVSSPFRIQKLLVSYYDSVLPNCSHRSFWNMKAL